MWGARLLEALRLPVNYYDVDGVITYGYYSLGIIVASGKTVLWEAAPRYWAFFCFFAYFSVGVITRDWYYICGLVAGDGGVAFVNRAYWRGIAMMKQIWPAIVESIRMMGFRILNFFHERKRLNYFITSTGCLCRASSQ
jgi:hypothetical protein